MGRCSKQSASFRCHVQAIHNSIRSAVGSSWNFGGSGSTGRNRLLWVWLACGSVVFLAPAWGQGLLTIMDTGQGRTLLSEMRVVTIGEGEALSRLQFTFGFSTDEDPRPGGFHDSFTVTMQDPGLAATVLFLTADAHGVVWAPSTPGTVPLDPAAIEAAALGQSSLQPVFILKNPLAYEVSAAIPGIFYGRTVNVYFDLYNNLDPLASQAWFSDPRVVVVPEPAAWILCIVAGLSAGLLQRRKR
jgi:hypothetical protein